MKKEEQRLELHAEPLQYVHTGWTRRGVVMMWMAETELSNVLLVRYVRISWLRWPAFVWDEAFTFIEEKGEETTDREVFV